MARSIKKGPFVEPRLLKRVQASNSAGQKDMIKTYSRASVIIPDMVGFTISVYNGKTWVHRGMCLRLQSDRYIRQNLLSSSFLHLVACRCLWGDM